MDAPAQPSPPTPPAAPSSTSQEDWKFPGGSARCSACERELLPGDQVTSVVRFGAQGPERSDLCASCGQAVAGEADVFFWRRTLPESDRRRPVVDYTMLREIFARLLLRTDEMYQRLAYLVALVLIRKRHLRLVAFEARAGREVMVVRRGAGHPSMDVPAPYLTAEDMVSVREHLTRLMAAELPDEGDLFAPPDAEDGLGPEGSGAAPGEEDADRD